MAQMQDMGQLGEGISLSWNWRVREDLLDEVA